MYSNPGGPLATTNDAVIDVNQELELHAPRRGTVQHDAHLHPAPSRDARLTHRADDDADTDESDDKRPQHRRHDSAFAQGCASLFCHGNVRPLCAAIASRMSHGRLRMAALWANARDAVLSPYDPRASGDAAARRRRKHHHTNRRTSRGAHASGPEALNDTQHVKEDLRKTRLMALSAILFLLLFVLALLAVMLVLLIFGPQMYEDRLRKRQASVSPPPSEAGADENLLVARVFDAFGVGLGGEHERRLKLHEAQQRQAELLQRKKTKAEEISDALRDPVKPNPRHPAFPPPNVAELKELLKLDLGKNNRLLQLHAESGKGTSATVTRPSPSDAELRRLQRRNAQLKELSAWLRVIEGNTDAAAQQTEAAHQKGASTTTQDASGHSHASATATASTTVTSNKRDTSDVLSQPNMGTRTAQAAALHDGDEVARDGPRGLSHFTSFYQKLKSRYSDEAIAQMLAIASGRMSASDPAVTSKKKRSRRGRGRGPSSGARSDEVPLCASTDSLSDRNNLLGFAKATGRYATEHKRLRPMDEIELLKYRHLFIQEELHPSLGYKTKRSVEGDGGKDLDGAQGADAFDPTTAEQAREALLADIPRHLRRVMRNRQIKRALYASAPSLLNRHYYFPLQRYERVVPYSQDTVRNMDAWYTPVSAEFLFFLGAARDGEGAFVPVASPSPAQGPAVNKNAYLGTGDPLLPISLLQNELKFPSPYRQAAIGEHLSLQHQLRGFANKENMLENLGNLLPIFSTTSANGAVAAHDNHHVSRLLRRLNRFGVPDAARATSAPPDPATTAVLSQQRELLIRKLDKYLFTKKQMTNDERTIFVSMAAYRDVECAPTLYDMYRKAKNPHRVFAGIAEQNREGDPSCLTDVLLFPPLPCYAPASYVAVAEASGRSIGFGDKNKLMQELWEVGSEGNTEERKKGGGGGREGGLFGTLFGKGSNTQKVRGADGTGAAPAAFVSALTSAENFFTVATTAELITHVLEDPMKLHALSAKSNAIARAEHHDHYEYLAQQRAYSLDESFPAEVRAYTNDPAVALRHLRERQGEEEKPRETLSEARQPPPLLSFASPPGKLHHFQAFYSSDMQAPMVDDSGLAILPKVPATDFTQRLCFAGENVRVRRIRAEKAFGPTFGRYMAMLLYRGESLVFVIDSHNRFAPMWDSLGVNLFSKFNDERVGLSHYPEGYPHVDDNPNDQRIAEMNERRVKVLRVPPLEMDDAEEERQVGVRFTRTSTAYLCKTFFLENFGYLRLNGIVANTPTSFFTVNRYLAPYYRPAWEQELLTKMNPAHVEELRRGNYRMPQPWIAGGFLFTSFHQMREVPFDPHLPHVFDGEEVLFGMRLWTHGFTLFSPEQNLCYHFYTRPNAPKVWNEARSWYGTQTQSRRRIQYLLRSHAKNAGKRLVDPQNAGQATEAAAAATHKLPGVDAIIRFQDDPAQRGGGEGALQAQTPPRVQPTDATVLVDVDRFSMGRVRSVEDWYAFAGVNPISYDIEGRFCGKN